MQSSQCKNAEGKKNWKNYLSRTQGEILLRHIEFILCKVCHRFKSSYIDTFYDECRHLKNIGMIEQKIGENIYFQPEEELY